MIDKQDNCLSNCFSCNTMEQCSRQCIRRTFYAVMVGASPIVICLLFIGLARLILYRLEIAYYRRQKPAQRRTSLFLYHSGRLALSYTPVSNAELQRVIQGKYEHRQANDSLSFVTINNTNTRKTPKFIKSLLPRREPALPSTSILANLVRRRDVLDANQLTEVLAPTEIPLQPTFSIVNEQEKRRPSVITIRRESIATTTLTPTNNINTNPGNFSNANGLVESEEISNDSLMTTTQTTTTTTTVVVEEFLDFHSINPLPSALTMLNFVSANDNDINSEINNDNDEQ